MSDEEKAMFTAAMRAAITRLAAAAGDLKMLAESFEARGGEPVFGTDVLIMVVLNNDLQTFLDPGRRVVLARYRSDF